MDVEKTIAAMTIAGGIAAGAIAGAVSGGLVANEGVRRALLSRPIISSPTLTSPRQAWVELPQVEVDKLAERLKALSARKAPTHIVCVDRNQCGELALNLENAFETAGWQVAIVHPTIPGEPTSGIRVDSREIVAALKL